MDLIKLSKKENDIILLNKEDRKNLNFLSKDNLSLFRDEETSTEEINNQVVAYRNGDVCLRSRKNSKSKQFFTLSLLEYICILYNPKDVQLARIQFKSK
jgi:hypothetical protein